MCWILLFQFCFVWAPQKLTWNKSNYSKVCISLAIYEKYYSQCKKMLTNISSPDLWSQHILNLSNAIIIQIRWLTIHQPNFFYNQGVIQKNFLGGSSTKKCDYDCDWALIKSRWDLYRVYIHQWVHALATSG